MSSHNIWNSSWGSITNRESTPTSQWSWNTGKGRWVYTGPAAPNPPAPDPPSTPPPTNYHIDDVDCDPVGGVHGTNDPPQGGESPVGTPGGSRPTNPVTPPTPNPVSTDPQPVKVGGKMYNVCFDDALLNQKGWTRSRWEGSKLQSLYYNEYTDELEEGKPLGPYTNKDVERFIDGLHFILTGSASPTTKGRTKMIGDPFERPVDSGIVMSLNNVYTKS